MCMCVASVFVYFFKLENLLSIILGYYPCKGNLFSCNKISISVVICFSTSYRHKNISSTHFIDAAQFIIYVISSVELFQCIIYTFIINMMYLINLILVCGSYWFHKLCNCWFINLFIISCSFYNKI